ncbi:MAG: 12-oxophytodienoate reductase [Hyphomonadaceae bacterium]
MTKLDISPLLTPIKIARMTMPNRFVMAPMGRASSKDGVLSDDYAPYYRRRVEGGVGLIIGEATAVPHPTSQQLPSGSQLHGAGIAAWKRVADEVHAAGGLFMPQLWHAGLMRAPGPYDTPLLTPPNADQKSMGPSGLFVPAHIDPKDGVPAPVSAEQPMTPEEIDACIAAYAEAAHTAFEIGCDGIELHGAHGYLIDQFLWPNLNRRTDAFGGDIAGRVRFAVGVVRACRAATAPDFPIFFRMSQWKQQDYSAKLAYQPGDLEAIVAALVDAGVDAFDCSARRFWEPEFEGSHLNFAGWVRKLSGKPTMMVGSLSIPREVSKKEAWEALKAHAQGITTVVATEVERSIGPPHKLDDALERFARGEFDMLGLGRILISNPSWVHLVERGDHAAIEPYSTRHLLTLQ